MPCNTAHAFLPAIREAVRVPFIDMIGETAKRLVVRVPRWRVGLMATTGTIHSGLYHLALGRAGLDLIHPPSDDQEVLRGAIAKIKEGELGLAVLRAVNGVAERLIARDVATLVAGCTELPLAFERLTLPITVVDPVDVLLAEAFRALGKEPVQAG